MARSSTIYLVMQHGIPIAAFTVKWEMNAWIKRNPGCCYRRFRMKDGDYGYSLEDKSPVVMQ
jgi:hypothetical protein